LRRPWPDLSAIRFPAYAPLLVALALLGSFLPGLAGTIAGVFAAALLIAFAVMGLAVLHAITRGMRGRLAMLLGTYVLLAIVQWPILVIALLGLAETGINLRGRIAARQPPPSSPSPPSSPL